AALVDHVAAQLVRCFGRDAPSPLRITVEDWAGDPCVAVAADLDGDGAHPEVGPAVLRQAHLEGRVWLAGAETSDVSPGLIEGAIAAGARVAARVLAAP
ncbi:MAG: FAD-dependent oxidoreductase, partial [Myxococcales bacterium]|nr:FAD-dependent oxidoreductase [Myxococcales bacterium]